MVRVLEGANDLLSDDGNLVDAILAFIMEKVGEALTAITHLLHEKLPWLTHMWEEIAGFLVYKLENVLPPGSSSVAIRVWVQLAMAVVLLVGPVLLPYILSAGFPVAAASAMVFARCLNAFALGLWWTVKRCARGVWWTVKTCARGFWWMVGRFNRGSWRMMKAPGRPGMTILRAVFLADPRRYFAGLRAGRSLFAVYRNWLIFGGALAALVLLAPVLSKV